MAIYDFLQNVMPKVDANIPVCTIFCDMTQAFDCVRHDILIEKLEAYGIRGNVSSLIQSYLSNRRQFTEISTVNKSNKQEIIYKSSERIVKFGVPQGTVVGPLFFILYVNDLPKIINHPVTLFADDSTITIACKNRETYETDINTSIEAMIKWLENNNLKINLGKTHILHFSQRSTAPNVNVHYRDNHIGNVNATKFLGLTIDSKLDWKAHTEALSKKICSSTYALYKLAPILNVDALLTAYHGLVSSNLRYGVIFWGNSTNKDLIFKTQKRCLRTMFGLQVTESCKTFFKKYKILTLPSMYILETVMFVKLNPHLFPLESDKVVRNRRDNSKLCIPRYRTALLHKSIFRMAPILYNKLPKYWREYTTAKLRNTLKSLLLEKVYYSTNEFLTDKLI